ncbi:hypothetical protein B0F90DRAFT_1696731, partial [Multifurca ochricompacta]
MKGGSRALCSVLWQSTPTFLLWSFLLLFITGSSEEKVSLSVLYSTVKKSYYTQRPKKVAKSFPFTYTRKPSLLSVTVTETGKHIKKGEKERGEGRRERRDQINWSGV